MKGFLVLLLVPSGACAHAHLASGVEGSERVKRHAGDDPLLACRTGRTNGRLGKALPGLCTSSTGRDPVRIDHFHKLIDHRKKVIGPPVLHFDRLVVKARKDTLPSNRWEKTAGNRHIEYAIWVLFCFE